ncbi:hypothetical protein EON65_21715, partial [archaeon]
MDPDQEYRMFNEFFTYNYVTYQPNSNGYVHPTIPSSAMVCAVGKNNMNFFVGLAMVNSQARATHFGFQILNPAQSYTNNVWRSFGGNDVLPLSNYTSRMRWADEAIHLTTLTPSVKSGEIIQLDFAHIVATHAVQPALNDLTTLSVVQPTDIISGTDSLVLVEVAAAGPVVCTFSLFAVRANESDNNFYWHELGSATAISYNSTLSICSVRFNSSLYKNGEVELSVASTIQDVLFTKHKAVRINNQGQRLCFVDASIQNTFQFMKFYTTVFSTQDCTLQASSQGYTVQSVSFYLEFLSDFQVTSRFISSSTSSPYSLTSSVATWGTLVSQQALSLKAVTRSIHTQSSAIYETVATISGYLNVTMPAPTRLPSRAPTVHPTVTPTKSPTTLPTFQPSGQPTGQPTLQPTQQPSGRPSSQPSIKPSAQPSSQPSSQPSQQPSGQPS